MNIRKKTPTKAPNFLLNESTGVTCSLSNDQAGHIQPTANCIYITDDPTYNKLSLTLQNNFTYPITLAAVDIGTASPITIPIAIQIDTILTVDELKKITLKDDETDANFIVATTQLQDSTWALFITPKQAYTLNPKEQVKLQFANLTASDQSYKSGKTTIRINFSQPSEDSSSSASFVVFLNLIYPSAGKADLNEALEIKFEKNGLISEQGSNVVFVSNGQFDFSNTLKFTISNRKLTPLVPTKDATQAQFIISFIATYDQNNFAALCEVDNSKTITINPSGSLQDQWTAKLDDQTTPPIWRLIPSNLTILDPSATAEFTITCLVTHQPIGLTSQDSAYTPMYITWCNIPGYNDDGTASFIQLQPIIPIIQSFIASKSIFQYGEVIALDYELYGADWTITIQDTNGNPIKDKNGNPITFQISERQSGKGTSSPILLPGSYIAYLQQNIESGKALTAKLSFTIASPAATLACSLPSVDYYYDQKVNFTYTITSGQNWIFSNKEKVVVDQNITSSSGSISVDLSQVSWDIFQGSSLTFSLVCNGPGTNPNFSSNAIIPDNCTVTIPITYIKHMCLPFVQNTNASTLYQVSNLNRTTNQSSWKPIVSGIQVPDFGLYFSSSLYSSPSIGSITGQNNVLYIYQGKVYQYDLAVGSSPLVSQVNVENEEKVISFEPTAYVVSDGFSCLTSPYLTTQGIYIDVWHDGGRSIATTPTLSSCSRLRVAGNIYSLPFRNYLFNTQQGISQLIYYGPDSMSIQALVQEEGILDFTLKNWQKDDTQQLLRYIPDPDKLYWINNKTNELKQASLDVESSTCGIPSVLCSVSPMPNYVGMTFGTTSNNLYFLETTSNGPVLTRWVISTGQKVQLPLPGIPRTIGYGGLVVVD